MGILQDISHITLDEIEDIEKLSLRWLVQATMDFGYEAFDIFNYSPDNVKDVAEDVTREIVERLSGYNINQRIFGTVDYKKARYIVLPNMLIKQALFVDSKAEKNETTATLQVSQTSLEIRQIRNGQIAIHQGTLPKIYLHGDEQFLTTTLFLHYCYEDNDSRHRLKSIIACCVPNGLLQDRYNPTPTNGFWLVGRNSPVRGEDFRVRVSFNKLKQMKNWRVQYIRVNEDKKQLEHIWDE